MPMKSHNETLIFLADCIEEKQNYTQYYVYLTSEERKRADAFIFGEDRVSYVMTHGKLNEQLGYLLKIMPSQLRFIRNAFGKPFVHPNINNAGIQFNISHTRCKSAIMISKQNIGVDIESQNCSKINICDLNKSICHTDEYRHYQTLPFFLKDKYLYKLWVMKEAILKLIGTGLSMPMSQIKLDCFVSNITSVKLIDLQETIFVHYTEYERGEHLACASFIKMYPLHFSEKNEINANKNLKNGRFWSGNMIHKNSYIKNH